MCGERTDIQVELSLGMPAQSKSQTSTRTNRQMRASKRRCGLRRLECQYCVRGIDTPLQTDARPDRHYSRRTTPLAIRKLPDDNAGADLSAEDEGSTNDSDESKTVRLSDETTDEL